MGCSLNELPSDTLLQILYKLPQNLIHRCKCVCKLWSSLISQPCFAAQYLLRTKLITPPPNPTLYVCLYSPKKLTPFPLKHSTYGYGYDDHHKSWSQDSRTLSFGFLPQSEPAIRLLCTSNGLALCSTSYDCKCIYYVCNPVTKHWLTLPPPPICTSLALVGLVSYDRHFKVVRLVTSCTYTNAATCICTSSFYAETFDSRTNLWKVSPLITIPQTILFWKPTKAVEYKGILHWVSSQQGSTASQIMAFDPNLEKCRLIQALGNTNSRPGWYATGVSHSGEHLYHVQVHIENRSNSWRIWRLIEAEAGEDEWCLEHTFRLEDLELIVDENCILPSNMNSYLLAVDPIDPNVLYFHTEDYNEPRRDPGIISVNIKTGRVETVYFPYHWKDTQESLYAYEEMMVFAFVPPSWPTSLPKIHHLDMIKE